MRQLFNNAAQTILSAAIDTSQTTIPVANGAFFSNPTLGLIHPFAGTINSPAFGEYEMLGIKNSAGTAYEIVRLIGRAGNNLTVQRAQEGTTATAFALGDTIFSAITSQSIQTIVTPETVTFDEITDGTNYDFYFVNPSIWKDTNLTFNCENSENSLPSCRVVFMDDGMGIPDMEFKINTYAQTTINFFTRDGGGVFTPLPITWLNDTPPFAVGKATLTTYLIKLINTSTGGLYGVWQTPQVTKLPIERTYNGIPVVNISANTTIAIAHLGKDLQCTGAQTLTIPSDLYVSHGLAGNAGFMVTQLGTSRPIVAAGVGVTLHDPYAVLQMSQYSSVHVYNVSGNTWRVQ